jgi:16S rRNA (uracil1498-N3)-methyltransferase
MGGAYHEVGGRPVKKRPWILASPGAIEVGEFVILDPVEARHVSGSLRRRAGDEIVLADGRGCIAVARLTTIERSKVEAEILAAHREPEPTSNGVTLALAMVSGQQMDWAVQKAVEVGVRCFVPLATERSQLRKQEGHGRMDHWQRVARQALKQCRRPWAMEVGQVVTLSEFVENQRAGGVVADREGCAIHELPNASGNALVVGPEGGFSQIEGDIFDRDGWTRLRVGPHILRSETAAIVGGAMMVARDEMSEGES